MTTPLYLASTEADAQATAEVLFEQFLDFKRATDPDAVTPEGEVMYRSPFTGELEPDAPRSTSWTAAPQPVVQGFTLWQPEHTELQLADPAAVGVEAVVNVNPWPTEQAPVELPTWVQPLGAHDAYPLDMWVEHNGANYRSLLPANVWEPSPQSNFWRISPDPGPLPWVQPTGSMDAYAIGDRVTHTVAGRDTDLWESNIDANTQEPGQDSTFDRWWKPITDAGTEIKPWVQPMPGTANPPYELDAKVTHGGKTWTSTEIMNVWAPGVFGWVEATGKR